MADVKTNPDDQAEASILSLRTLFERPMISIDGALYEITSPDELTVEQEYQVGNLGRKLQNLRNTDGLNEAQQKQLRKTLDELCHIILDPVPQDVRATLTDPNKRDIVEAFSWLLSAARLKRTGAMTVGAVAKLVGELPSQGSSASTAEARKAG